MSKRVCSFPSCPVLIAESGYCEAHKAARRAQEDARRGTRAQRGYGASHESERRKWAPVVATGTVTCWRCGELIPAGAPWQMGHDDNDRSVYRGPECRPCNLGRGRDGPRSRKPRKR